MICIARNKTFYHNFYFWPGPFHSLKSGHGNRRFVSSGRIISDIYKQTSWQVKQGLVIRPFLIIVQLNSISICLPISISLILLLKTGNIPHQRSTKSIYLALSQNNSQYWKVLLSHFSVSHLKTVNHSINFKINRINH